MKILVALVLLAAPLLSHAWGGTGHRIVCEIAYQELAPDARAEVDRLIALDGQYDTYADSCNYPDKARLRLPEHYVNFSRQTTEIERMRCLLADECLLTAITKDIQRIQSASIKDATKLKAIKFLGHWIGDLHQPLHISFSDDRGGNSVTATGQCEGSLHGAWDTCMVHARILKEPYSGPKVPGLVSTWRGNLSNQLRNEWRQTGVVSWANESFEIVRGASIGYCDQLAKACVYDQQHKRETYKGGPRREVLVDKGYIDEHIDVVTQRLFQAGVRLAKLLNNAL